MSGALTVETYDDVERSARDVVSNAQMAAFQPVTFHHVGYPTRISADSHLTHYVDLLYLNPHSYLPYSKGEFSRGAAFYASYSPDEADLVTKLFGEVARLTERDFGRAQKPLINGLNQLGVFRAVMEVARLKGGKPLRIFEIGPGFGYLGAYLASQGQTYYSMDVTQSLYLWQSRLMSWIFGNEFSELAVHREAAAFPQQRIVHIPWWIYCNMFRHPTPAVDVVVANGVLGEMSPGALMYTLKLLKVMMRDSECPLIIFNNFGNPIQTSVEGVKAHFAREDFQEVLSEKIHAYSPAPSRLPSGIKKMEQDIPLFRPSGRGGELGATEFVKARPDEMPSALAFNEFVTGWKMPNLN